LGALLLGAGQSADAFSMLGPNAPWQVFELWYDDEGGPMNLGEEYRWNIKTIYYAYDQSFLQYFGQQGVDQCEKAFAIMNALPPVSQMSSNLTEYPLDSKRVNYTASALNVVDISSWTLEALVRRMGLAQPERWTWCLRGIPDLPAPQIYYSVIKRNFDPISLQPSSYVNGVLYSYRIVDDFSTFADAVEVLVDPLQTAYTSVASLRSIAGDYYTGLTRDDVGGLRHLYGNMYPAEHWHVETLPDGTFSAGTSSDPWGIPGGTSGESTSNFVNQAIRPGVDKINYVRVTFDSGLGGFTAFTNQWTDTYISNSVSWDQEVKRAITQPDLILTAEDLGLTPSGVPIMFVTTSAAGWTNNDAINGSSTLDGPGVITLPVFFRYSKIGPYWLNQNPFFLDEYASDYGLVWGAFDGTTNPPIVFPNGTSIQAYEAQFLYGGYNPDGSVWTIPDSLSVLTNSETIATQQQ